MGVSEKLGLPLFWGPYNKDPTIWGTILGSSYFRKLPYRECICGLGFAMLLEALHVWFRDASPNPQKLIDAS